MAQFPELKGRNIPITGGANGIGAAMVRAFRHLGPQVFFCDRYDEAGLALAGATKAGIQGFTRSLAKEDAISGGSRREVFPWR